MKYRDINFERYRDKRSYGDYELSTRQIVRKNKRRWGKFYMSVLSGYLSVNYWDLLDGSDKDGIMHQWSYRYYGFYNRLDCYNRLGEGVMLDFVDWIKLNYKVDKSLYREDILKGLGI